MTIKKIFSWLTFILCAVYFLLPLIATFEFSLRARRGVYSLDAYRSVIFDPQFQETFAFSIVMAILTIIVGVLIVTPTVFWIRLKLPALRPWIEFVTLLPLVIPPIVLVFGYIRLYNTSSLIPLTGSAFGTNILLVLGYTTLSLPYIYRAIDTGLRAIDIRSLTEAAQILGASWFTIFGRLVLPNVLVAVLSGAFLTFAIVIGEYVLAALLDRPAFGPFMVWIGSNRAYEPAALAVIAFSITWACMGLIQLAARLAPHTQAKKS